MCKIDDSLNDFKRRFKFKFNHYSFFNKLYLEYLLFNLKESITPKIICAHLFWCRRTKLARNECNMCCEVKKFSDEPPVVYLHSKHYTNFWDAHAENVFAESGIDNVLKDCVYFENIYTQHQFINLFGSIAIRLFFNVAKKNIYFLQNFLDRKSFIGFLLMKAGYYLLMYVRVFLWITYSLLYVISNLGLIMILI